MNNEPLVTVGLITAFAAAVIGVLVAFAVPMTDQQQTAILALVGVVAPILVVLITRPKVTPEAKAQARVAAAAATRSNWVEAGSPDPESSARRVDLDPPDRGAL
jgi:hypothetical protein